MRIEKLQNTLRQRAARAIEEESKREAARAAEDIQREETRLLEEQSRQSRGGRSPERLALRNLRLREIGLESMVAAYRPYPGPALRDAEQRLRGVRDDIARAEAQIAQATRVAAALRERTLSLFREKRLAEQRANLNAFRMAREQEAARSVWENKQIVELELGSLSPLEVPAAGAAVAVKPLPIAPPGHLPPGGVQPAASSVTERNLAESRLAIASERTRIAAFLRDDIKRRIARIALQNSWNLVFEPRPGLTDLTEPLATALKRELGNAR